MPAIRPQTLNDVFQQAANQARQKLPELTHNQQVARLYRKSLKVLSSWAIDRDIFNDEATKIRARFDQERGCKPEKAIRLLREAEDEIFAYTHPDPYCNPVMPGGSKFMRNPPLPMDVCFPDGNYPADAPKYEINPDWSKATPENGKAATGYVLVDFGKKNME
ncbi:hypothetical protein IV203_031201 [Nitzschia inconspicua]|uniref:NADH dehydrogenase [ubiquinone] 1 beta subcomplex subunit 9 n=1 Tax=Nitzschia inconspicua TaxID=303405 RepID=A0A9K3Q2F7_9STRA|nr:hypothetical protein IV203_031201 [Nitzschia inconspicua]